MNAVGIDVSKGKSTVTIRRPGDVVLMPPCDIPHTQSAINALIEQIKNLDGETKACMEHTGRYYEPVANWLSDAGIFVSAVNPILIRDFGDDSLRAPKTDKADSKKIARYALDRWAKLKQYGSMDKIRNQLKTMNRQFGFYMDQKTAMKNNLISLLDQTFIPKPMTSLTALPAVTAPRNGWTLSTPTGMWTVYAASLCKPLRSITGSGANATVITSVPQRRKRSIRALLT